MSSTSAEPGKRAPSSTTARVLLFADGTVDPVHHLRQLIADAKSCVSLDAFLRIVATDLRSEIANSTSPWKKKIWPPSFSTVCDLVEWWASFDRPQIAVSAVLLGIVQIGEIISHVACQDVQEAADGPREFESNPSILAASRDRPLYSIGLCNGLLAAAAVASCSSVAELLSIGPRIVCLNARLMLAVVDRSRTIDPSLGDWTVLTPSVTVEEHEQMIADFLGTQVRASPAELESHHRLTLLKQSLPTTAQPYISACSDTAATISGPPSTLSTYFASNTRLQKARRISMPVDAACHAPHLWSPDVPSILGDESIWRARPLRSCVKMLSIHSGELIHADDLAALLLLCCDEILNKQFRWNKVLSSLVEDARKSCSEMTVFPVGPDRVASAITSKLLQVGVKASIANPSHDTGRQRSIYSDDIAIVGVSSRLPGADTLEEVWQLLRDGHDAHGRIPPDRFDLADHLDPDGRIPNTTTVPWGNFIGKPGAFDAKLFNMSPREAKQTDPMQRLSLLTTYEALEMAGYSPNSRPTFMHDRIGTFWGQTIDDYRETNASQNVDIYYISGGIRAFGPGRLNYHFKWEGPSMSVDTACSSSALAIQLAFQSLRLGECDTAVAGGANIITGPDMYAGLSRGGFLSPTGQCKTFDNEADGYCRGEGVGCVVLKRLRDAQADGDNVLAVIKSCATNHSAYAESITRPHSGAQIKLMRKILRDAGLQPSDVDYVEMHGTGTQAGDAAEFSSVSSVFSHSRAKGQPIHVGSIKANIGHGEAAAGINSLVKVLLMLRYGEIPPHIGIKGELNTKISVKSLETIKINRKLVPFPKHESRLRQILLNSFNAAGGNTAMIIADAPKRRVESLQTPRAFICAVSGRTEKSFEQNHTNLLHFLKTNPHVELSGLSYTTTARRMHHSIRKAYVANDIPQLVASMSKDKDMKSSKSFAKASNEHQLIFAFTGQGSHTLNMARTMYQEVAHFRSKLDQFEGACQNQSLPSFLGLIRGDPNEASTTAAFQTSIVAVQLALVSTLQSWNIKPRAVIGHSIGEYAALVTAGVLSELDGLLLAGRRALMIEKLCTWGEWSILAIATDIKEVEQALSQLKLGRCAIACHNTPSSFVVSGPQEDLALLAQHFGKSKVTTKPIGVPFGFHSPQMEKVAEQLRTIARGVQFRAPKIPIASTLHGKVINVAGIFNGDYLFSQTLCPVKYFQALRALSEHLGTPNESLWLEIGTHPVCGSMIMQTLQVPVTQVSYLLKRDENPWQSTSKALVKCYEAGCAIDWTEYYRRQEQNLSLVELPRYAFDLADYWLPYKNSWRLSKGQLDSKPGHAVAPAIDPTLKPFHRLRSEQVNETKITAKLDCHLDDPEVAAMISGHLVEGVPLCSSSVYAHLAYHAAVFVMKKRGFADNSFPSLDLTDMEIVSPLTSASNGEQKSVFAEATWEAAIPGMVLVTFTSLIASGEKMHCRCKVITGDATNWAREWREINHLIESQVERLLEPGARTVDTMHRRTIYALFASAIVRYSVPYQRIQRMNIDFQRNEAVAELVIDDKMMTENGSPGPFSLDAIMHMAGFVLNASPMFPDGSAFIASGWSNFRFAEALVPGASYTCYTRMLRDECDSNLFVGNVSILSDQKVIGICRGLKFHRLRRTSLRTMLGLPRAADSSATETLSRPLSQNLTDIAAPPPPRYIEPELPGDHQSRGTFTEILEHIAAETSVAVDELGSDTLLWELGINSLLTLSLLKRFKQRTGTDLPANIFNVCSTIGELETFIEGNTGVSSSNKPSKATARMEETSSRPAPIITAEPPTKRSDAFMVNPIPLASSKRGSKAEQLCAIICSETGMDMDELMSASSVNELGIDSLATLAISKQYRLQTGEELSARFFYDNTTVDAMKKALGGSSEPARADTVGQSQSVSASDDLSASTTVSSANTPPSPDLSNISCVSMLIQGQPSPNEPALFLLPDGSGSLFSYVHIPELRSGLTVYAFDSPFHKNPKDWNISFEAVAEVYVREILRLQPNGPYMIGGWSLGGAHSFEVSRQLLAAGKTVTRLFLIDSPCPGTVPPLPDAALDLLEKAGIFQGLSKQNGGVASRTREHFVQITNAFRHWDYRPLTDGERARLGKVSVIWAEHGVLEDDPEAKEAWVRGVDKVDADMLKAKEWLCDKRHSFGSEGWDKMAGMEVDCYKVPGNHFSMMFPPVVSELGLVLRKAL